MLCPNDSSIHIEESLWIFAYMFNAPQIQTFVIHLTYFCCPHISSALLLQTLIRGIDAEQP